MSLNPTTCPSYLVEHLHESTGDAVFCDVTKFLANALDSACEYLSGFPDERFEPEVSFDEDGEVDGIAFFDEANNSRAFITVYHLGRDEQDVSFDEIGRIAKLPKDRLQEALVQLLA